MTAARRRRARRVPLDFSRKLVLNQHVLSLFGCRCFDDLVGALKAPELEGLDAAGISLFHRTLVSQLPAHSELEPELLLAYDQSIVRHTRTINRRRQRPIRWKYFQYLALLFTELYLDRFFRCPHTLLEQLNQRVEQFNQDRHQADAVGQYRLEDLRKLAFWNATGSGKTLLMHVNILQYRAHLAASGASRSLNRILLLTPNEGLSRQHLEELRASGIEAALFDKDACGPAPGRRVEVIDIHKIREEMGDKTVAVEAFEGNNLVLVDEGHRGAGGEEWLDRRNRLCERGFSFEYSATFGQAIKAAGKPELSDEYARCILFDYSYRYFHADGYGKDYRILNLEQDDDEEVRTLYLTAALLTFYQQLRLWLDRGSAFRPFLVERPLWIFVGSSVTRATSDRDLSDIEDILLFFARFVARRAASVQAVERILSGRSGLCDRKGRELFPAGCFGHLASLRLSADRLYEDLLQVVFNARGGKLHVEELEGTGDELALRLGDSEPFGVVNVSSVGKLRKRCERRPELVARKRAFSAPLFPRLDAQGSTVNLLVGAKKFLEGWSSWRVSSMGLMNIGRKEGAQIIQLFGRGVRLKGYDFGLKRSSRLAGVTVPPGLLALETLDIFGIRADYMRQFEEYLREEGLEAQSVRPQLLASLQEDPARPAPGGPHPPVRREGDHEREAPVARLGPLPEGMRPVALDWYPRIRARQSRGPADGPAARREKGTLGPMQLAFVDSDELYFELVRFKRERGWHNLLVTREDVQALLEQGGWYTLYIPPEELEPTSFEQVHRWQEIAAALLKKYCEGYQRWRTERAKSSRTAREPKADRRDGAVAG